MTWLTCAGVQTTAHQFQHWVPKGYEARVIVVGDRVFSAGIYADSTQAYVDWRSDYDALKYVEVTPPGEVTAGVLEYCVELELFYGAFDFVITPEGTWVFLECNPGGQYGWIEAVIGAPITDALADLLGNGTAGRRLPTTTGTSIATSAPNHCRGQRVPRSRMAPELEGTRGLDNTGREA